MFPGLEQSFSGFAQTNLETLEMLQKALSAGTGVDAASFTGGRSLIPESLDTTLVNILHTQDEARLFQKLKKQPIKSPVHQWSERTEVGADDGAWVAEGAASQEADQTLARKYVAAKYLQTKRTVTLQASISNMIEDAIALEENAGTLWLIRNVEKKLFYGNAAHVTQEPDGMDALIPATNVLDARGADATSKVFEDKITEACRIIRGSFGKASDMFMSLKVTQDVQQLLRDRIRFEAKVGTLGSAVFSEYPTPFGVPKLVDNIFITEGDIPAASTITASRPGVLDIDVEPAASGTGSQFGANDVGNYYYKFVGVNQYGDGAVSAESAVVAVGAGEEVAISVGPGSPVPTAIKVYRTQKDGASGTTAKYCFTVPVVAATDPTVITDTNADLPGCSSVYFATMDPIYNAIEWAQFLPMMKFDLYPTAAAVYPFLMLLFGALILKKPVQHARIKNVAPSDLGWF